MRRSATTVLAFCAGLWLVTQAGAQNDPKDPNSCRALWSDIGLPERSSGMTGDTTYVCRQRYIVEHNDETKTPDWVIERLTPAIVTGSNNRPGTKFAADDNLPEDAQAKPTDYAKSGYAIGHQAPSADFKSSDELMRETFFLSNAVPQEGIGFNTGIWSTLEGLVQKLAKVRPVMYIITGPVYQQRRTIKVRQDSAACQRDIDLERLDDQAICPAHTASPSARCTAGVAVPAALFKIVYDPGRPSRANAFLLPNIDHSQLKRSTNPLEYLKQYQVRVSAIDELTGYKFFTALTTRQQSQLKENCGAIILH